MAARSIDAAGHYLIVQDQLADRLRALNLQRSGDAREDYFVDGFTEEIISQLVQLQPANLE